jgi:hypothetical protein
MNKKATLRLRDAYRANPVYPDGDPRNASAYRRLKKAYNSLPRPDRDPARIGHALIKRVNEMFN